MHAGAAVWRDRKISLFIFSMLERKLDEPYPDNLIDNTNPV
jgi:hypothetical protein